MNLLNPIKTLMNLLMSVFRVIWDLFFGRPVTHEEFQEILRDLYASRSGKDVAADAVMSFGTIDPIDWDGSVRHLNIMTAGNRVMVWGNSDKRPDTTCLSQIVRDKDLDMWSTVDYDFFLTKATQYMEKWYGRNR